MKKFIFTILLLGLTGSSFAQEFSELLALFKTSSLPYDFPEGAVADFGDEPFEHPYERIDVAAFNTITDAYVPDDSELFAVNRLSFDNYHLLVVFEFSFDRINGMIERRFVLYTVTPAGKLIDQRFACTYEIYSNTTNFGISEAHSTLAESEYAGEEGILILETIRSDDFRSTEGTYNERIQTITTTYSAIDPSGKIRDITSYMEE